MINLKIDPEFQSQIPPLTDDEFKQLEENILIVIDRRFFILFDRCSRFQLLFRHFNIRLMAVDDRGNGIQQGSSYRCSSLNSQRLVHQIHGRRSHAIQLTDFFLDLC